MPGRPAHRAAASPPRRPVSHPQASCGVASIPTMTTSLAGPLGASAAIEAALGAAQRTAVRSSQGALPSTYPVLAEVDPQLFGLCAVDVAAGCWQTGDAMTEFAVMSAIKPFTFALVCAQWGVQQVAAEIGVNATGGVYNDPTPVRIGADGRTNPMVNAGAIATVDRIPGADVEARWQYLLNGLSAFAGRPLSLSPVIYDNVSATNARNRELAEALAQRSLLVNSPTEAVELYTRQSCLTTTAQDLAVMGATLANAGRNPITGIQVVPAEVCSSVLAVMLTAGLYENSGEWLYEVGLPAKTGLGGGIVAIVPGRGAIGGFSPLLDAAGNTVRGAQAVAQMAQDLELGLL